MPERNEERLTTLCLILGLAALAGPDFRTLLRQEFQLPEDRRTRKMHWAKLAFWLPVILSAVLFICFAVPTFTADRQTPVRDFIDREALALLEAHRGEPIILHVTGPDCSLCVQDMRAVSAYAASHPEVFVITIVEAPPESLTALVQDLQLHQPVVAADPSETRRYDNARASTTLAIGRDGRTAWVHGGYAVGPFSLALSTWWAGLSNPDPRPCPEHQQGSRTQRNNAS